VTDQVPDSARSASCSRHTNTESSILVPGTRQRPEISWKLQELAILHAHCAVVGGHPHTFQIEEV
jgi:hypothetical protein